MTKNYFSVLEFDKIRQKLKSCATSSFGKELAEKIEPNDDFDSVKKNLELTTEAVKIFAVNSPPLGGIFDIREVLKKISLGSSAAAEELLNILSTIFAMRNVKKFFKEIELDAPKLKFRAAQIEILGNLEKQLDSAIDEHGTVKDSATSANFARHKVELKQKFSAFFTIRQSKNIFKTRLSQCAATGTLSPSSWSTRRNFPELSTTNPRRVQRFLLSRWRL